METEIGNCFVSYFVGRLHRAVDSPWTQMSGSGRSTAVEPASITFSGFRWVRDARDFAAPGADSDGKAGRAETSGVRLRTVCDPPNSGSHAVHVE